jgi:hypothetical protein
MTSRKRRFTPVRVAAGSTLAIIPPRGVLLDAVYVAAPRSLVVISEAWYQEAKDAHNATRRTYNRRDEDDD